MARPLRARSRVIASAAAFITALALVLSGPISAVGVENPTPPPSESTVLAAPLSETEGPSDADGSVDPNVPESPVPSEPEQGDVSAEPSQPTAPAVPEQNAPEQNAPEQKAPEQGAPGQSSPTPEKRASAEQRDAARAPESDVEPASFFLVDEPKDIPAEPGQPGVITVSGIVVDDGTGVPLPNVPVGLVTENGAPVTAGEGEIVTDASGRFTATVTVRSLSITFGPSLESSYVAKYGSIFGLVLSHSYELGEVALQRGAVLSGTLTAPAADVDSIETSVSVYSGDEEYSSFFWHGAVRTGDTSQWSVVVPAGTYQIELSDGSQFRPLWWGGETRKAATPVTVSVGDTVNNIDGNLDYGENSISGVVRSHDGTPLAGVRVNGSGASGENQWFSGITDSQGRYFVGNVKPGTYKLSFDPPAGYGVQTFYGGTSYATATDVVFPSGTPTTMTGMGVTIHPGATVTGMFPAGAWPHIQGVQLRDMASGETVAWTQVRADGSFQMLDVPAGTYRLVIATPDISEEWGDEFTVAAGDEYVADVADFDTAFAHLAVTVDMGASSDGRIQLLDAESREVVVEKWTFESDDLEIVVRPGAYIVRFIGNNDAPPIYYAGAQSAADATILTLAAGEPQAITFMAGTASIAGTVTDSADGSGLAGIRIELYRANQTTGSPMATTSTDADGTYAFEGLGVNNYAVRAVGGEQLYADRWFGSSSGAAAAKAISLGDGESFSAADFELTLGGGVRGTFPEARDAGPEAYLSIYLHAVDGDDYRELYGSAQDLLADGFWEFLGVPSGEYQLGASLDGVQVVDPGTITVVAGEITDEIELVLPGAQIAGTVRSGADGNPARSVMVTAYWAVDGEWDWPMSQSVYTDANGDYRLGGLPAGAEVILEFRRSSSWEDYSAQWWQGATARDEATPIVVPAAGEPAFIADVELAPAIRVQGSVIDALTGDPVPGVWVNGSPSDSDGKFTAFFEGPGTVELSTEATSDHVAYSSPLELPADGLKDIQIALDRGFTLSGSVVADNNSVALGGVEVRITPAHDEYGSTSYVSTNSDGTFTSTALAPGRYKVETGNWQGLYVTQWYDGSDTFERATEISVVDAPIEDIDVRMTLGGTVTGRIVDADGRSIAGATVGVATAPETGFARMFRDFTSFIAGPETNSPILGIETTTDEFGNFRLPPLEPGDYTLYVYTPDFRTLWYNGKSTRAEADIIHVPAGEVVQLDQEVQLTPLAEGETSLPPEQTLSSDFAVVASPADVAVESGDEATFTALASGTPVPAVQWQRRDSDAAAWTDILGADASTLLLPAVALSDDGTRFRAVFTQGEQELVSAEATLTVTAAATAPAAPDAPTVTSTGQKTATVEWSAPVDGGSPITGYRLTLHPEGSDDVLREIRVGAVTSAEVGGLVPGTSYDVTITAVNAIGAGAASPRTPLTTIPLEAPDAPRELAAAPVGSSSLALSWIAPVSDGGSPITGYRVTVQRDGDTIATLLPGAGATSAEVAGLDPDTSYSISLVAINAVGQSVAASTEATTAKEITLTVPGAPNDLEVTSIEPTQLTIAWSAPVSDGGSPITDYEVAVAHDDEQVDASITVTGLTAQITGLDPSTDYVVSVTAVNTVGAGAAASTQAATTAPPAVAPSALRDVIAVASSSTSVSVSWEDPESDGGAEISGYEITVTRDDAAVVSEIVITGNTAEISGLTPDTEYSVSVAAKNAVGTGHFSDAVTVRTSKAAPVLTAPGQPGQPTAHADSPTAVSLAWAAPADDGGSSITGYLVRAYLSGGTSAVLEKSVTTTSAVISDLAPATEYTFTVEAKNEIGASTASAHSAAVTTPAAVAGKPVDVTAEAVSDTEISVAWKAPANDGGAPVSKYIVQFTYDGGFIRYEATASPHTESGLESGTAYDIEVFAVNSAGTGTPSDVVRVTTKHKPTDEPTPTPTPTDEPTPTPTPVPTPTPTDGPTPTPTQPEQPTTGSPTAPDQADLTDANRGGVSVVSSDGAAGGRLVLAGLTPGASYDAWFFSTPTYAGLVSADASGRVTVTIPRALDAGEHRVVLVDPATGEVSGWAEITLDPSLATTGGGSPVWLPITAGMLTVFALACFVYARRQRERAAA